MAGGSWRDEIAAAGFHASRPAVVASTGVSMYLTREANAATLRQLASLARHDLTVTGRRGRRDGPVRNN